MFLTDADFSDADLLSGLVMGREDSRIPRWTATACTRCARGALAARGATRFARGAHLRCGARPAGRGPTRKKDPIPTAAQPRSAPAGRAPLRRERSAPARARSARAARASVIVKPAQRPRRTAHRAQSNGFNRPTRPGDRRARAERARDGVSRADPAL